MSDKLIFIVDGHNFAARAWYVGKNASKFVESRYTVNAAKKQLRRSLNLLTAELEDYVNHGMSVRLVMAMDRGKTWRHIAYPPYKAKRPAHSTFSREFFSYYPKVIQDDYGVEIYWSEGNEADDVMATIAHRATEDGWAVRISSTDHDMLSLATKSVGIVTGKKDRSGYELLFAEGAQERIGVSPELIPFYKSLKGDVSDNIPGVVGMGETAARRLCSKYSSVAEMHADVLHLSKRDKELFLASLDREYTPYLFEDLATLRKNVIIKRFTGVHDYEPENTDSPSF